MDAAITRLIAWNARKPDASSVDRWIAAKLADVEANPGRRGNPARRETVATLYAAHQRMARNLHSQDATTARPAYRPAQIRKSIEDAAWTRGSYGELIIPPIPAPTHPALAPYAEARDIIATATAAGLLPDEMQDWDDKGRGSGVAVDLYSYVPGLVLVQIRRTERRHKKYYLAVTKSYHVTDGGAIVEVAKHTIKRAATADPAADAPLRAIRAGLPATWQERIPTAPVSLARGPMPRTTCYKIVAQDAAGNLHSLYQPEYGWTLGKWQRERKGDNHTGGLYAFPTAAAAIAWFSQSGLTCAGNAVLCECTALGVPIEYANGKRAYSALRIERIIGPANPPTTA